jgi:hypothetical protein
LNAPIVRWWFRWILRIHGDASSVGNREITRIITHAIFWWEGPNQRAEFRTHAKFSKRLYYAFRPLWWAIHFWDQLFADRWLPRLSFGFNTLTTYPDADPETTTVDGMVAQEYALGAGVVWSTIRAGAGTYAEDSVADNSVVYIRPDSGTNKWREIDRGIHLFDTSSLTVWSAISAAVMSLWGTSKADDLSISPDVDIYVSAPASTTALATGDFDSLGSTSQTGSPITYTNWGIAGYNDFTFNATGRGNISKTGISKFGTRNANYDVSGTAPAWSYSAGTYRSKMQAYFADQTGTTNDPKLVVTYTTNVQVADSGSGTDAISVLATFPISDSGSGTDSMSVVLAPDDSGVVNTLFHFTSLTGGGAGALDSIDGGSLIDGDRAFCIVGGAFMVYYLDADSGASESVPNVIAPDTNPGTKRWIKCT